MRSIFIFSVDFYYLLFYKKSNSANVYNILYTIRMQMHFVPLMVCLYVGLASARTEEDQQASNVGGVPNSPPVQCFYRPPTDCPDLDADVNRCPCKKITLANAPVANAALCCNTDSRTLEYGLSCIGMQVYMRKLFLSSNYN